MIQTALFPSSSHDHRDCIVDAISAAAALCDRRGARLTSLRRRVLEIIWHNHEPTGAYSILEELQKEGYSAAPPTVYRSLDFLLSQGFVHRIESLNAFMGCVYPGDAHGGQFLICVECSNAVELVDSTINTAVAKCAENLRFEIRSQTIEVAGLCYSCRQCNDAR